MDKLSEPEQYKAAFIYKAVKDGWTVSMGADGEFEFVRPDFRTEYLTDSYSSKFLQSYGSSETPPIATTLTQKDTVTGKSCIIRPIKKL